MSKIKIFKEDGTALPFNSFKFSAGEIQVRLDAEQAKGNRLFDVFAPITSSDDFMEVMMLTSAISQAKGRIRRLVFPYMPYSRQDRVCYPGEAFGLNVMAHFIRQLEMFDFITWDMHSAVTERLLGGGAQFGFLNRPASSFVNRIKKPTDWIISPDHGAVERASECCDDPGKLIVCDKVRDPNTGHLSGARIAHGSFPDDADLLIVDDICDGGRTFVNLAKVLRQHTSGKIKLYVTHGIFSQGFDALLEGFDEIYTANSFKPKELLPASVTLIEAPLFGD